MNWKYYKPKFDYEERFQDVDWPWAGHKYFAYDLVRNLKPEVIVELGTHKGTSFFSFCQGVKDAGLKTQLGAVDTWKGDEYAGFYDESVFKEVKFIKDTYYPTIRINLLRKTFDEALEDFSENSIDILHIDGLHTYEAVKHDYESWFDRVKNDGIILFHDVVEKSGDFGVYKLWDEIKKKYKTIEFHHSHGLGVLFKKPDKFKKVFDFQEIWKNYYSALFENVSLKNEMNKKSKIVENKNKEIEELLKIADKRGKEIGRLNNLIGTEEEILKEKEHELESLNQVIQRKNSMIVDLKRELRVIKSSKFWKAREKYLRIKNIFSRKKSAK